MATRFRKERGRNFDRFSFRDNPPGPDYDFWFYLGDGSGCTKLVLTGRTYDPRKAKDAARQRLGQSRAARLGESRHA